MRYILCEDSGSGRQFYECIKRILDAKDVVIRSSYGNRNYSVVLEELYDELQRGDKLLLAFDNVESGEKFVPVEIVRDATYTCEQIGAELWLARYYCFEEIFLSCDELINMCRKVSKNRVIHRLLPALVLVQNAIINGEEYYGTEHPDILKAMQVLDGSDKNKESFCALLLQSITHELSCRFEINKGHLGQCWLCDCCLVELGKHKIEGRCQYCTKPYRKKSKNYMCSKYCTYCMADRTSKEKLEYLEKHTLSTKFYSFAEFYMN